MTSYSLKYRDNVEKRHNIKYVEKVRRACLYVQD